MRRDKWLACLISTVLSFLISFAGVMCLQSAFRLEAGVAQVALGCTISAVAFSVGFTTRFWYIPLLMAAPVAGWLWQKGSLSGSIEYAVYQVSALYNNAYRCGVLYWSEAAPLTGNGTMALCAVGSIVAFLCAWVICRRKSAIFAVFTAILPLAACFVVTDTVPASRYLYFFLLGVTVLLLCQLTRRKNARQANKLVLLVSIPAALALLVLFWAIPRDSYRGQERADRILAQVQSWVEDLSQQGTAGTSTALSQTVELDAMGRLVQTHTPVMTVSSQRQDRVLYLRQQGFQMYDGTAWHTEYSGDLYAAMDWSQLEHAGGVTISTQDTHLMKFTPYYSRGVQVSPLGITENIAQEYTYDFETYQLPADAPSAEAVRSDGTLTLELPIGRYPVDAISLPGETVEWAEAVVAPLIAEQYTLKDRAEAIGAYVRSLARYDKNTARMPAGETDFARWFVQDAESGYCVHYATTATVLLRAAGIHAQYVEGYVANTVPGTAVTVYEDQAHAWVEYFDPAVGWRILEATPSEGVPSVNLNVPGGQQNQPQTPQTTEPSQQTPSEQPGQEPQEKPAWAVLYWILGVLGGIFLILLQWQVRLRWRKGDLTRGTTNQRAVKLWRRVARLSRLLKKRPKRELLELAQKAKFSNHLLSDRELQALEEAREDCIRQLKEKPWYCQPVYTVILSLY